MVPACEVYASFGLRTAALTMCIEPCLYCTSLLPGLSSGTSGSSSSEINSKYGNKDGKKYLGLRPYTLAPRSEPKVTPVRAAFPRVEHQLHPHMVHMGVLLNLVIWNLLHREFPTYQGCFNSENLLHPHAPPVRVVRTQIQQRKLHRRMLHEDCGICCV